MRVIVLSILAVSLAGQQPPTRDPAAWGANHAGQPIPEFVHGDECLFCHRKEIGNEWQRNRHGVTIRQKEDAPAISAKLGDSAKDATHFLGSRDVIRLLKKDGYGKFQIAENAGGAGAWDTSKFAAKCAGCHTTAVEASTNTFQEIGLDCYVCHGSVDLKHTGDTSLVLLSKKRRNDAQAITSICAQCHLRGAVSKSTGLPYANNFVAGDNLFQDLKPDWALANDESLNAGDRHIYRNAREVAVNGGATTCLNCHKIHGGGAQKHRLVLTNESCLDCHNATGPKKETKRYKVLGGVCEYQ